MSLIRCCYAAIDFDAHTAGLSSTLSCSDAWSVFNQNMPLLTGVVCFLQRMIALGCAVGFIALLPVYLKHVANRRAASQSLPELVKKPE